jgi:hypothetical protein
VFGGAPNTTREGDRTTQERPALRVACAPHAGLTILEMLVSTAMLSFIVLGLTAMLIQTQKAFKSGIRQNTITDAGRSIMDIVSGDLRQMSDAQNTNFNPIAYNGVYNYANSNYNFYWDLPPNVPLIVNYLNGVAIRTNELNEFFILEHTNTMWVGVGYAVSNFPGVAVGSLYRYETNWNSLTPAFANDLFSAFYNNILNTNFSSNYWHKIADGVVDLRIRAFDQYGNDDNEYYYTNSTGGFVTYPTNPNYTNGPANLPFSVELELGILEPDTLIQARALAGIPTALANFLSSNAAPNIEVFRQRITIAAATR